MDLSPVKHLRVTWGQVLARDQHLHRAKVTIERVAICQAIPPAGRACRFGPSNDQTSSQRESEERNEQLASPHRYLSSPHPSRLRCPPVVVSAWLPPIVARPASVSFPDCVSPQRRQMMSSISLFFGVLPISREVHHLVQPHCSKESLLPTELREIGCSGLAALL